MQHQLPLEFTYNNECTFSSFVTGTNRELVDSLVHIRSASDFPFVYFWGKPGTGKSHLLHALCQSEQFHNTPVAMIPLDLVNRDALYSPQMLEGLEKLSLICIDGVQSIAAEREWEHALFHLYNRARDASTPMVVTGDRPPARLPVELADLKTRLAWGIVLELRDINDDDKLLALQIRAKHRGMELNEEVGEFLLRRYSRNMSALAALLDRLDKAGLSEQRRLTVPFVKQILEN